MTQKTTWRRHLKSLFSWGYRLTPPIEPTVNVELPLTPAHVLALRHHVRAERRWFLAATAAATTFTLLLSVGAYGGQTSRVGCRA